MLSAEWTFLLLLLFFRRFGGFLEFFLNLVYTHTSTSITDMRRLVFISVANIRPCLIILDGLNSGSEMEIRPLKRFKLRVIEKFNLIPSVSQIITTSTVFLFCHLLLDGNLFYSWRWHVRNTAGQCMLGPVQAHRGGSRCKPTAAFPRWPDI